MDENTITNEVIDPNEIIESAYDHIGVQDDFVELNDGDYIVTNTISSKVGYLIGVEEKFFRQDYSPLNSDIFDEMEEIASARIIRNLCIIRTALMSKNKYIRDEIKYNFKTIDTVPDLIPTDTFRQLKKDGVYFVKGSRQSVHRYLIDANLEISNRINNCKDLFPTWVVWDYIKNLFIMPNGLDDNDLYKEMNEYYFPFKGLYPYTCYINWRPTDVGNLLENDRKLLTTIYEQNGTTFTNLNCITQLGESTKEDIVDFIKKNNQLDIIVDCENANPFRLAVALKELSPILSDTIEKLILINDPNAPKVWDYFENLVTGYNVEQVQMNRINERKSLVDIGLTAKLCEEYYTNQIDSFIICSSDSDFWGVIKSLPSANYMVLVEHDRVGIDLKKALTSAGILYVYTDEFYEGEDEESGIKNRAILHELKGRINESLNINTMYLLNDILKDVFVNFTDEEKEQFLKNFIKSHKIEMSPDGSVELKRK